MNGFPLPLAYYCLLHHSHSRYIVDPIYFISAQSDFICCSLSCEFSTSVCFACETFVEKQNEKINGKRSEAILVVIWLLLFKRAYKNHAPWDESFNYKIKTDNFAKNNLFFNNNRHGNCPQQNCNPNESPHIDYVPDLFSFCNWKLMRYWSFVYSVYYTQTCTSKAQHTAQHSTAQSQLQSACGTIWFWQQVHLPRIITISHWCWFSYSWDNKIAHCRSNVKASG